MIVFISKAGKTESKTLSHMRLKVYLSFVFLLETLKQELWKTLMMHWMSQHAYNKSRSIEFAVHSVVGMIDDSLE